MGLTPRWSSMDLAEGIVLIDELETHLHPRWKLEIVSRLRSVFPKLTFIATTHDPLCLRGLEPGEIVVLRKDGMEVTAQPVTESIAHLRADQLLTSELFGLSATRDPRITAKVTRHTELSSKPSRTSAEEKELATLGAELKGELVTAETPAGRTLERGLKELINEQIIPAAQQQMQNPALMGAITDSARNALNALLQLANPLVKPAP
jgi:hypothetical protein